MPRPKPVSMTALLEFHITSTFSYSIVPLQSMPMKILDAGLKVNRNT